jgi:hypothetical protein
LDFSVFFLPFFWKLQSLIVLSQMRLAMTEELGLVLVSALLLLGATSASPLALVSRVFFFDRAGSEGSEGSEGRGAEGENGGGRGGNERECEERIGGSGVEGARQSGGWEEVDGAEELLGSSTFFLTCSSHVHFRGRSM